MARKDFIISFFISPSLSNVINSNINMQIDTRVISVRNICVYIHEIVCKRRKILIVDFWNYTKFKYNIYYIIFGNEDTYEEKKTKKKKCHYIFDLFFRIDFTPTLQLYYQIKNTLCIFCMYSCICYTIYICVMMSKENSLEFSMRISERYYN